MRRSGLHVSLTVSAIVLVVVAQAAYWTERQQNPSWFPYRQGAGDMYMMDLPIPTATPGFMAGPSDPLTGVQGYWPTYCAVGICANDKYYVCGGQGPNLALGAPAGYAWPSNSYGQGYSYIRQSLMSVYDPAADTWTCAKWDMTGPVPYNYSTGTGGVVWARVGDGVYPGAAQAFAFDYDNDGTEEIYIHGGYPIWDGWFTIFDPDVNGGQGAWSNSVPAVNYSSGYKAQYNGGCVRIGSNAYVIAGSFWGPPGLSSLQVFDLAANTWSVYEGVYSTNLSRFGAGVVGTKVYLLGGMERVGLSETVSLRYSPHVFMLDTENLAAGLTHVGILAVGVEQPCAVAWRGRLYVVAGLSAAGPTNLFQVFNPETGVTTVNDTPLPINAYGGSCAISTGGTFFVGGALRYTDTDGTNYNTSRAWTCLIPEPGVLTRALVLASLCRGPRRRKASP